MANRKFKGIAYKGKTYLPVNASDLLGYGDIAIQPPSRSERVHLPGEQQSLPDSAYDIHVKISKEDLGLLSQLPEAKETPISEFLQRARKKIVETGHAQCLASEAEVDAIIGALQNFVHSDEAQLKDKAHASDMVSYWRRNYLMEEKPPVPLKPRKQPKLPPSSNLRMFSYRGASTVVYKGRKYVRVADERETPEYVKPGKGPEDLRDFYIDQAFSALLTKEKPSINANIPVPQIKNYIDAADQAVQAVKSASNALNYRPSVQKGPPTARWLTDAFLYGKHNQEYLYALINDPETVRAALNWYIDNVNDFAAAAENIQKIAQDMLKSITEQGWASKYKLRKERKEQKKEILRDFFGMSDAEIKDFMNTAYEQAKLNLEKSHSDKPRETGEG
jgi:hypothetical protein